MPLKRVPIDKVQRPGWRDPSIADVSAPEVERHFEVSEIANCSSELVVR